MEIASTFNGKLQTQWNQGKFVCVGLDSDYAKIPKHITESTVTPRKITRAVFEFNKRIINATQDVALAYKPNAAFYEDLGAPGWEALERTSHYLAENFPHTMRILDAKRGDIGSTNDGYVRAIFDRLNFDAVTISPYLGSEALKPFLERTDKGSIILARTSNPGAGEFQDLIQNLTNTQLEELLNGPARQLGNIDGWSRSMPMYQYVAHRVANHWNTAGQCAIVVGATYPTEAAEIRTLAGDIPYLIPGVGAQGGDVETAVNNSKDSHDQGMIINSSRMIIFASKGEDYAEAARRETLKLDQSIRKVLGLNTGS